ncbi:MAG: death on curing protein [Aliidongia sp.]|nr:death on curing protein [Aliidongia sp.]
MSWIWIPSRLAIAWHLRLIEQFGGAAGIRDLALLESALDRPRNLAVYDPIAGAERLAALYGVGVAKAHAFVDGNKRIAFAIMVSFLKAHGLTLDTSEAEATAIMVAVAAGTVTEEMLARWLLDHCRRE